jgi:hypothetical protein
MDDRRLSGLEARLEGLEKRLMALESRLAPETDNQIQDRDLPPIMPAVEPEVADTSVETETAIADPSDGSTATPSIVSLLGRFLMILGGAFLLRAATDAGTLPPPVGVTLGLGYGIVQIWLAARVAARGSWHSANWFGLGAAIVILPLIVESTVDFKILSPGLAALLLPVLGFVGVAVAVRARLRPMAWVFLAGTGTVGLLLAAKTGFGVGFPLGVLLVGLAGLWLGYLRGWYGLAVVGSVVPVAMVMAVTLLLALEFEGPVTASLTPTVALILQLLLIISFLGSFLARALRWSTPVGIPEVMQSTLAMVIGISGALVSAHKDPSLGPVLGMFILGTGLASYAISFLRIDRREGHRGNFAFFSTVALVATLIGSSLILDGWMELGLFLVASLGLAAAGARLGRATLSLHAAIYVVGAGFASGLVPKALDALIGGITTAPATGDLMKMVVVILVALICCGAPVVHGGKTWGRLSRMPKAVYLLFLLITIDGMLTLYAIQRFAPLAGDEIDGGIVAALRTGILAVSAVVIAFVARRPKLREGARLVPLVLVFGAAALLLGDLRSGRPATQFASLALYGLALILAPRMARYARSLPK